MVQKQEVHCCCVVAGKGLLRLLRMVILCAKGREIPVWRVTAMEAQGSLGGGCSESNRDGRDRVHRDGSL